MSKTACEPITDFGALVLRAAADSEQWRNVLEAVIAASGAIKGIISLRDVSTAELYFPDGAATRLAAPLIVGIEPAFVESYLETYGALDVWTSVERRHHPHVPYFMSDHLAIATLRRSEFWRWLEPQGIADCLVAEIYRSQRHWVALNLHFDETAWDRKQEIMARVADLLPVIRTGWQLSEQLVDLTYANVASRNYLETWNLPCLVLDQDLVVTSANAKGLTEFGMHAGVAGPIEMGSPLRLREGPLRELLEALRDRRRVGERDSGPYDVASDVGGHAFQVTTIAQGDDVIGKRRANFLVVARSISLHSANTGRSLRVWETPGLTKKQAAIVKWIAEGGTAPDFAAENSISEKTAYDHLFSARQKLGGMTARDIYATHQALLRMER